MTIDMNKILDVVREVLRQKPAIHARAMLDPRLHEAGDKVHIGARQIPMPFHGVRVFLDLMPRTKWDHPVVYLLIGSEAHDIARFDEDFPPADSDDWINWEILLVSSSD
jgi:hypothetical protein